MCKRFWAAVCLATLALAFSACGNTNTLPSGNVTLPDADVSGSTDVQFGDAEQPDGTDSDLIPSEDTTVPSCKVDADCTGKITEPACQKAVCLATGLCGLADAENGGTCEDEDACTEKGTCKEGQCLGTPVTCDDANPCTDDTCDPKTGCVATANTLACDDGDACSTDDGCADSKCQGKVKDCDDGNPCTDETCDSATGCQYTKNTAACSDNNACTSDDKCLEGVCVGGAPTVCDDSNPCTVDSCDVVKGCAHVSVEEGALCSDGDACTIEDKCAAGTCTGAVLSCDDKESCTADTCDKTKGCINTADDALTCDDGNSCTKTDLCKGGKCEGTNGKVCDDLNACTDDSCKDDACVFVANAQPCDDGDKCTENDVCAKTTCAPGKPIPCDDGNPCTTDKCDSATGACGFADNTAACDDGNGCTASDICSGGLCSGTPKVCDDQNDCTLDSCTADTGKCSNVARADGSSCNDGSVCTQNEACDKGSCVGVKITCDDGNPCTDDVCDPVGGCAAKNNTAACDDGNACTAGDACLDGTCKAGASPTKCDDANPCTADSCDPAAGCVNANNTEVCNDSDLCTIDDKCADGACAGTAKKCDDGNVCTDDACDPAKGCLFAANTIKCTDGSICTLDDKCTDGKCAGSATMDCNDNNACTIDTCDPKLACQYASTVNGSKCDDGNTCTKLDACAACKCVGIGKVCDDVNPCTTDTCSNNICTFTANTLTCNDGNICTATDTCNGKGVCVGANPVKCDDINPCTNDSCSPKLGCLYVNNTSACDDGKFCTVTDTCKDGKCQVSVPNCNDGNVCTNDKCDEIAKKCVYGNNLAPCSDNNACTLIDTCKDGSCGAGAPKDCDDGNPCTLDNCNTTTGACSFALAVGKSACPALPVPVSLAIDYADPLWSGVSNSTYVKWMTDATPADPGKLTGAASLNVNKGTNYADKFPVQAAAYGKFLVDATKVTGSYLTFVFYSYHGMSTSNTLDKRVVEFSTDGFNTIAKAYTLDNTKFSKVWHMETLDVNSLVGKAFQVRFRFDSVAVGASGPGWFVDELNVYAGPVAVVAAGKTYIEGFANNVNGWQSSAAVNGSVWAIDATPAVPAPLSAPASMNFNNGTDYAGTVSGSVLSPVIDLEAATGNVSVVFREWIGTEIDNVGSYDKRWVEISGDAFVTVPIKPLFVNSANVMSGWRYNTVDLTQMKGKKIRLRFVFDSVDLNYNDGVGWLIDDVVLEHRPVPSFADGITCGDASGWTIASAYPAGPRWAVDNNGVTALSPDCSLNFNNGKDYVCSASPKVQGTATSGKFLIPVPATVGAKTLLTFSAYVDAETNPLYDKFVVGLTEVAPIQPKSWAVAVDKTAAVKKWTTFTYDVTAMQGLTVTLAFAFDSSDCSINAGAGVFIDDVMVRADK